MEQDFCQSFLYWGGHPDPCQRFRLDKHELMRIFPEKKYDVYLICLISLAAITPAWINYDIIANDGMGIYVPLTKLLLSGDFKEAFSGVFRQREPFPLYELLMLLVAKITGFEAETAGRLVSVGSFIAGAVGVYCLSGLLNNGSRWVSAYQCAFLSYK